MRLHYKQNKHKLIININEYYKNNPAKCLLRRSKSGAKKKNLIHNITENDIITKINECRNADGKCICPVLGIEMKMNIGNGSRAYNSLSIDRIDNEKGYIKDNIAIISWKANRLKSNGNLEDFRNIVKYLERINGESKWHT